MRSMSRKKLEFICRISIFIVLCILTIYLGIYFARRPSQETSTILVGRLEEKSTDVEERQSRIRTQDFPPNELESKPNELKEKADGRDVEEEQPEEQYHDINRIPEVQPKLMGAKKKRLNVLFLIADDLRSELGSYYDSHTPMSAMNPNIYTPNLDRLAKRSLLLKRAYVQQALCSPSRTSFLTGRRPDTTLVYDIGTYWRQAGGNFTTLPQYFKEHDYETVGIGKVFHSGAPSGNDDPLSWTYHNSKFPMPEWARESRQIWVAADGEKTSQYPLEDTQITDEAIKQLTRLAPGAQSGQKPFFLSVGFRKPHMPWLCPNYFYQLYPRNRVKLPNNPHAPIGMPELAWSSYGGLRAFQGMGSSKAAQYGSINVSFPNDLTIDLRRGYYACVSFVDHLVGQILAALDELGLRDSTVVSFLGDHGWQLGEHGEWQKQTNFELSNHAPLMISVPGLTDSGKETNNLVEFVDVFSTIVDAVGLPKVPQCPKESRNIELCTEGTSFLPLMTNPDQGWKTGAFSQYPRMTNSADLIMGYSMKTSRYRYTAWVFFNLFTKKPLDFVKSRELYDHATDPNENINQADNSQYKDVVDGLHQQLLAGWRAAVPKHVL